MDDEDYMRLALRLAERGWGCVSPNPMVGSVIVKDGVVIGRGWHRRYGMLHAEREALADCVADPVGATMYVTLEPCCHYGRQPPCVDAILGSGISRVVVGSADPNPLVAGRGISMLRGHGVDVVENMLRDECDHLNNVFLRFITTGRPFVTMKYAMTMDGRIATRTGSSRWITGEEARRHVQRFRDRYGAIMVGVGTVLTDDPSLTCHLEGGHDPIRIICDTHLRTPLGSTVVTTARRTPTVLATCCRDAGRQEPYHMSGCRILVLPERDGHVDLVELMERLGAERVDSVLLEGGGTLNWSALRNGIVQQVQTYVAPKLFGGSGAKSPIEGLGVSSPESAFFLKNSRLLRLGEDLLMESEVEYPCSPESSRKPER